MEKHSLLPSFVRRRHERLLSTRLRLFMMSPNFLLSGRGLNISTILDGYRAAGAEWFCEPQGHSMPGEIEAT